MIETKEQYEAFREFSKRSKLNWGPVAFETIEALRGFVRAHTKLDHARIGTVESLSHDEYNALVIEFRSARDALPEWIVQDE